MIFAVKIRRSKFTTTSGIWIKTNGKKSSFKNKIKRWDGKSSGTADKISWTWSHVKEIRSSS